MTLRIDKKEIILYFLLFSFFEPSYFSTISVIDNLYFLIQILSICWALIKLLQHHMMIDSYITKPLVCLVGMHSTLMICTLLNGGGASYDLKKMILDVGFILVMYFALEIYKARVVNAVVNIFMVLSAVNMWSVFAFYEVGMYEGDDGMIQYFWAVDNHFSSLLLSMIILAIFNYTLMPSSKSRRKIIAVLIISIVTALKAWCVTTMIGMAILLFAVIAQRAFAKYNRVFNYMYTVLAALVLQVLVVVYNIQESFGGLFEALGKDSTLSYRTEIWEYALTWIRSNVFIGKGSPGAFGLGGWYYNVFQGNIFMHNEFLELWVDGGLFALVFFLLFFILALVRCREGRNKPMVVLFTFYLASLIVMMISETVSPRSSLYVVAVLAYSGSFVDENLLREEELSHENSREEQG